ncbi:MAG: DNA primase [Candidatus Dojkabacteria bacterium]|nr:DNA primase [Candidatus Dojkabacteria bacterium]
MNDVDIIKSRINIVDIISEKINLKKSGVNYFSLCPFHNEDSPSFVVNENLQIFKCFGCGKGGDVFKFVMEYERVDFSEALRILANKVGYKLKSNTFKKDTGVNLKKEIYRLNQIACDFYVKNLNNYQHIVEYLKNRGLTKDNIDFWKIGYASIEYQNLYNKICRIVKNDYLIKECGLFKFEEKDDVKRKIKDKFIDRIIFPIWDIYGNIIAFSGRVVKPNDKRPKYLNSPDTLVFDKGKNLYGLYQSLQEIKNRGFVIITEGQFNVILSHSIGIKNIVAPLGTSFTNDHILLLKRYTNSFALALDRDQAGKRALLRTAKMLLQSGDINLSIVEWDSSFGKDPAEVIQKQKDIWIESVRKRKEIFDYFLNKLEINKSNVKMVRKLQLVYFDLVNAISTKSLIKVLLDRLANVLFLDNELVYKDFDDFVKNTSRNKFSRANRSSVTVQQELDDLTTIHNTPSDYFFAFVIQNYDKTKALFKKISEEMIWKQDREIYNLLYFSDSLDEIVHGIQLMDESNRNRLQELIMLNIFLSEIQDYKKHFNILYKRYIDWQIKQYAELYHDLGDEDIFIIKKLYSVRKNL